MPRLRQTLAAILHPLPVVLLAIFLCFLLVDAFPADSIHYHLPFAIRAFHLPGFPDYSGLKDSRYVGFPWLWRLMLAPGLALDRPRLFLLPNLLGLLLFVQVCHRYLRLARPWAACCCLVFPVALFSFRTSLQDFFVNTMVASAMLILLYPLARSDHQRNVQLFSWNDCFALLLLALAANTKFQGFFMAVIVVASTLFFRWREVQSFRLQTLVSPRVKVVGCALVLMFAISFQPIANTIQFRNPFYPIAVAGLPGDIKATNSPIQYLPRVPLVFNAASFVVSATEIDPIIRSQAGWSFQRSWHNFNKPKPEYLSATANHPWVMTGGSNGLVFILLAVIACYVAFLAQDGCSDDLNAGNIYRRHLLLTCVPLMFLPQAMELRYYMVILFVVSAVALSGSIPRFSALTRSVVVVALWFALIPSFLAPIYYRLRTGSWSLDRGLLSPDPYARMNTHLDCSSFGLSGDKVNRIDNLKDAGHKNAELLQCYLVRRGYRQQPFNVTAPRSSSES
jgi:hypothetical protein